MILYFSNAHNAINIKQPWRGDSMPSDQKALDYHEYPSAGKIEVVPKKPLNTAQDLSLAYTPGVALPSLEIAKNPGDAYKYTSKGNLVAVISNGTAVLGLGDIGAHAAKPVMEGKGCLFKKFADIDVFDIELNTKDPDELIRAVEMMEPTFGGINLEDIKAPECFYIEEQLKKKLSIPVMHDDQHGTAIITGAALLNALKIAKKRIEDIRVVVVGAGAAGIACAKFYIQLGVQKKSLLMVDRSGVIYKGRKDAESNKYKEEFAVDTKVRTLAEALKGADVFLGVSKKGILTKEMILSMNKDPIVFALANPDPEIEYEEAVSARKDLIMATGRSDYPNQVNNVLGFPFIFRGALDVHAMAINEEMKRAAAMALAKLAQEDVPEEVSKAYGGQNFTFGKEYLIPKPFDPRVLYYVAPAVAKAAMESKVARKKIDTIEYRTQLQLKVNRTKRFMQIIFGKAKAIHLQKPVQIVFADGASDRILRACEALEEEQLAMPVVLGNEDEVQAKMEELNLHLRYTTIIDPKESPIRRLMAENFAKDKKMNAQQALKMLEDPNLFGAMMVKQKLADGFLTGVRAPYSQAIRPVLSVLKPMKGVSRASGLYVMALESRLLFFADTTVQIEPSEKELAEIALNAAKVARYFNIEPKIAMLSFANKGTTKDPHVVKIEKAKQLVKKKDKKVVIDGPMQIDAAVDEKFARIFLNDSRIVGDANVLIFPSLEAGNIGYKLLQRLCNVRAIGPVLMGMEQAANIISQSSSVDDIVNLAAITIVQSREEL